MVESVEEFKDELKRIRIEIYRHGEAADQRLIASWIDRLVISLENICPALELMEEEISQISESESSGSKSTARAKTKKHAQNKKGKTKKSKKRR